MHWPALFSSLSYGRSMRRFVLAWVAAIVCALFTVDAWLAYSPAVTAIAQAHDSLLSRVASAYLRALRAGDADSTLLPQDLVLAEVESVMPGGLQFRVSNAQGALLGGDPELAPLLPSRRSIAPTSPATPARALLYDDTLHGEPMRVAAVQGDVDWHGLNAPVVVQVAQPHANRREAQGRVLRGIVTLYLVRLSLVVVLIWSVVRWAFRPLDALRGELIARQSNDQALLATDRPEELVPLVITLNELLSAQQASVGLQRKFLADVSHQLRTPLAVLRTQLQGLILGQMNSLDTLPKMLRTVEHTTGLANQLLSMAKVEQLVRRGEWADVDVEQVAREVALEFAPLMARKKLAFSLDSVSVVLASDAWLLGELVRNLLSNAIHHSHKGAALGIVIRTLRDEIELIVWDHAGGVDATVLPRLFEPFSAAAGGTGVGLGLSICGQIAQAMRASVELFNRVDAGQVIGVDAVVRWPKSLRVARPAAEHADGAS